MPEVEPTPSADLIWYDTKLGLACAGLCLSAAFSLLLTLLFQRNKRILPIDAAEMPDKTGNRTRAESDDEPLKSSSSIDLCKVLGSKGVMQRDFYF